MYIPTIYYDLLLLYGFLGIWDVTKWIICMKSSTLLKHPKLDIGPERWYHWGIPSSCPTATCIWVQGDTDNISREPALCQRGLDYSTCEYLVFDSNYYWVLIAAFWLSFVVLVTFEIQQHSFYELIINKARGKSGPVMFTSRHAFLYIEMRCWTFESNLLYLGLPLVQTSNSVSAICLNIALFVWIVDTLQEQMGTCNLLSYF